MTSTADALWTPSPARAAATNLAAFARALGRDADDYTSMHAWSIAEPHEFWRAIWQHCGIVGEPGTEVYRPDPSGDMAAARFFPDASLNVAENLMARMPASGPVLIAHDEVQRTASLTADDLRGRVASLAAALRADGVGVGDRVVVMLPNGVDALVVMLAATAIGATFASASPDFGAAAILDRFGQIEPVALFGCAEITYAGKRIDCREKFAEVAAGLPTARIRSLDVGEYAAAHTGAPLEFVRLPFDHPWYVLFSSGTTGKPKCIVHRTGGVLLMHAKEQQLHCDVRPGDVVTYYTTTGWMMWNWLASILATGATVVLYDGSPLHPRPDRLFEIAALERLTLLGVSAKFIDTLTNQDLDIAGAHDLSALRTICSTGSPLPPSGFDYVYARVKQDVHLASISGGTDLCACFLGGVPTLPVHRGEIQRPALGMDVRFFDDSGAPITQPGIPGELVCARPFPSQPLGFLGDEPFGASGPKYRAAYYERFPGVWAHGDFASWTVHGGAIIHGRSDATLNPGGVRIGTADIYRVVEEMPEIAESIAFAQEVGADVRIVLAVRMAAGTTLDDEIVASVKRRIRTMLSPRHVPAVVIAVEDLPRTFSNKLVELAVADIVNGRPVRNRGAIANPDALDAIAAHPGLRG